MRIKQISDRFFWNQRVLKAHFSDLSNTQTKPINYFFVDTNVIIGYRFDEYSGIKKFIENPENKFFYTETVLDELQAKKQLIPEANPDQNKDKYFTFVNSKLRPNHKLTAVGMLQDLWIDRFKDRMKNPRLGYQLTAEQLESFKRDLFIIFESGYVCHAPGVLPDDHLFTPPLLTNNMQLLKKFIVRPEAEKVLETTINLNGMEHLMPIVYLEDVIEEQQLNADKNSSNNLVAKLT